MKKTHLFISALYACFALSGIRVLAHIEGHPPEERRRPAPVAPATPPPSEHGHEHTTKVPDTIAEIWTAIEKQQDKLTKTVAAKNLDDAHDHAFAIRDLANNLVAKVPETKRKDVEIAAKKISDLATAIDKSSAAGAQKTTESNAKAMTSAIKTLKLAAPPHDHS
jgi:hypothetical protein